MSSNNHRFQDVDVFCLFHKELETVMGVNRSNRHIFQNIHTILRKQFRNTVVPISAFQDISLEEIDAYPLMGPACLELFQKMLYQAGGILKNHACDESMQMTQFKQGVNFYAEYQHILTKSAPKGVHTLPKPDFIKLKLQEWTEGKEEILFTPIEEIQGLPHDLVPILKENDIKFYGQVILDGVDDILEIGKKEKELLRDHADSFDLTINMKRQAEQIYERQRIRPKKDTNEKYLLSQIKKAIGYQEPQANH